MTETFTDSAPRSDVVVFDFDGTLVSRDSFVDFSLAYCRARPARLLLIVPLLPVALLLLTRSQGAAGSVLLWAMTVGCSTRSFVLALRGYATSTLTHYAFEEIFAELAWHLGEGRRVVIATGSVPTLVRALLSAREIARIPIAGTRLRRRWGGLISETHCTGEVKVHELRRRFGIGAWTAVYTNSFADRPLLSGARDVTLVHPNRRTLLLTQHMSSTKALRVLRPSLAAGAGR